MPSTLSRKWAESGTWNAAGFGQSKASVAGKEWGARFCARSAVGLPLAERWGDTLPGQLISRSSAEFAPTTEQGTIRVNVVQHLLQSQMGQSVVNPTGSVGSDSDNRRNRNPTFAAMDRYGNGGQTVPAYVLWTIL